MHARPATWSQRRISVDGVRFVPVDTLPAGFLAERGAVAAVPGVGARGSERASGPAFVTGVADVVIGLVDLPGPRQRVAGGAVVRAEAANVHLPHIERRFPRDDPVGHQLSHSTGAGEAVSTEPGGDEHAAYVALAEAELAVGGERLRTVDQPRHLDLLHRGDAPGADAGDLLEPGPVLLQQQSVEIWRNPVELVLVQRPGGAVALVAAHHQPAPLLAEIDQQVGVSQRGEVLVRG